MSDADTLRAALRDIPDFPKPGIIFKDITPILGNGELFQTSLRLLAETARDTAVDKVVGIDARGFIFAAAVADRLKAGFVPIRKKGKLPWKTREASYTLEYGEAVMEIHQDAVNPGENTHIENDPDPVGIGIGIGHRRLALIGNLVVAVNCPLKP